MGPPLPRLFSALSPQIAGKYRNAAEMFGFDILFVIP
jgi:hypothetical protein